MALETNSNPEDFGNVAGAGGLTISHASYIFNDGQSGNTDAWDNEFVYWTGPLTFSRTLSQGDAMEFPAGAFDVTHPAGDLQGVGIQRRLQASMADLGSPTVRLGVGSMGTTGKQNEVTDAGYTAQVMEFDITA